MVCDILLVQPPHSQSQHIRYYGKEIPLSLAYLSTYLEKNDFYTKIIDLELHEDPYSYFKKSIKILNPQMVGITAFTIDILNAHLLAKIVKEFNPNIYTVIGGLHASALPIKTLEEFKYFDYLIYGESLITLTELSKKIIQTKQNTKKINDLNKINGLVYRKKNIIKKNKPQELIKNFDAIPFPARNKLEYKKYKPHLQKCMRLPSTGILSSMGCPFKCNYCSVNIVNKRIRFRSPENILNEIKECINKYRISDFRFFDDCMTLNRNRLIKLCKLIIKNQLDIFWNCQSRVDTVDFELLKLMKKARCHQITYGVETGTEKNLKMLCKNTTLQQARKAIKLTKKVGLESGASFMIGVPEETIEDVKQTINFAKELSPDLATFYVLKAYPGSHIYKNSIRKKILKDVNWNKYSVHNPSVLKNSLEDDILIGLLKEAYTSFYFRSNYVIQRAKKVIRNPLRETKLILEGLRMLNSYF